MFKRHSQDSPDAAKWELPSVEEAVPHESNWSRLEVTETIASRTKNFILPQRGRGNMKIDISILYTAMGHCVHRPDPVRRAAGLLTAYVQKKGKQTKKAATQLSKLSTCPCFRLLR